MSTQCIFLLVRSFIDPTFCGIFVCGPWMFKCQIKRWLYLSVNVMSTKLLKYWGWDHQFTWSSKPREGLAIVRHRRYLHFSFLTKSIGSVPVGPRNRTGDLPLCSRVLHRLSYSPAADLATGWNVIWRRESAQKRTKLEFRCPICRSAIGQAKTFLSDARQPEVRPSPF